jgi:hypothetical protein
LGLDLDDLFPRPDKVPGQFTAQPYPLFLADWNNGEPLIGRIIGWLTHSGGVPTPVVAFEDQGETWLPLAVYFSASRIKFGPSWIRDSLAEAKAAAEARRVGHQEER